MTASDHYPRIKRLSGGDLLMIYMDGKFGWNIYARKSKDDGLTWSDAVIVRQSYKDPGKNVVVTHYILRYEYQYKTVAIPP